MRDKTKVLDNEGILYARACGVAERGMAYWNEERAEEGIRRGWMVVADIISVLCIRIPTKKGLAPDLHYRKVPSDLTRHRG